jgi:ABC-type nitrate/sulfonate/bicarbonate transport system permease component
MVQYANRTLMVSNQTNSITKAYCKDGRLILILIASYIYYFSFCLFFATSTNLSWKVNVFDLVIDSVSSVYRMFAALAISFLAALVVGVTAARNRVASRIILPIIDTLQSVPILGFFPAAIAFFITLFNE